MSMADWAANYDASHPEWMLGRRKPPLAPAQGSALFSPEMLKLATVTEAQERYIRLTERCPVCLPHEGQAEPMRLLGDFGPMRGYQCKRCNNVWCISAPNSV